jgi:hypothetical protein
MISGRVRFESAHYRALFFFVNTRFQFLVAGDTEAVPLSSKSGAL